MNQDNKKESKHQRSAIMARVRSKNTSLEIGIRKFIYKMGFRYRLHGQDLPGKPDIVFRKLKKVIFVHGCFWHGHNCCRGKNRPSSNTDYWIPKLNGNKKRDLKTQKSLKGQGWRFLIIWECEVKNKDLGTRIYEFLNE